MAFFSVVIPLYNKQKYIAAAVESILAQTFSDFEIIVVDDCSTDTSVTVVSRFSDPRIKIISRPENGGLSATRNTGINAATSEFIAFLDADDTWKPEFLRRIRDLIELFPRAGLFATAYEELYPNGKALLVKNGLNIKPGEMDLVDDFFLAAAKQPIISYASTVIKKEVFENAGYFDEQITLGEDVDFNIRANVLYDLAYYNASCARYTMHSENQITKGDINSKTITDFNRYERYVEKFPSLKRYLDTNRYVLAMDYKLARNESASNALISQIDPKSLSVQQRLLLKMPAGIAKRIRNFKLLLLKVGIRVTSFD